MNPTSYSSFKLQDLETNFGIKNRYGKFLKNYPPKTPSAWLLESLDIGVDFSGYTEKSRSEWIIAPILSEIYRSRRSELQIYSGMPLVGDADVGLTGVCDFVISKAPGMLSINAPVLLVTEAKKQDFDAGIAQCCAELLGARLLNQREGYNSDTMYGVVSTGEDWKVIALIGTILHVEPAAFQLNGLDKLLGTLDGIIGEGLARYA